MLAAMLQVGLRQRMETNDMKVTWTEVMKLNSRDFCTLFCSYCEHPRIHVLSAISMIIIRHFSSSLD